MNQSNRLYGASWCLLCIAACLLAAAWNTAKQAAAQPTDEAAKTGMQITPGAEMSAQDLADFLGVESFAFTFRNIGNEPWRLVYDHWEKGKLLHASGLLLELADRGPDPVQIFYRLEENQTRLKYLVTGSEGALGSDIPLGAAGKGNHGVATYGGAGAGREKRIALSAAFFDIAGHAIVAKREEATNLAKKCGAAVIFYAEQSAAKGAAGGSELKPEDGKPAKQN